MNRPLQALEFLQAVAARGERGVLVAIAQVIASASRGQGTLMAVSESGAWCGSLSGGCVEAAVIGEALRVLAAGRAELLRLGQGSPLIDVRLPCGGGLDLLIVPEPDPASIAAAVDRIGARGCAELTIAVDGTIVVRPAELRARPDWTGQELRLPLLPTMRLFVVGQGEEVTALARQALAFGAEVSVLTPDPTLADQTRALGAAASTMHTPRDCAALQCDPHAAAVLFFHEHDWEGDVLHHLLGQQAFFIGAMGSPRTHALRLDLLRARGWGEADLQRIIGPVGLIPSTRDPDMLALSVLAQVAATWASSGPV